MSGSSMNGDIIAAPQPGQSPKKPFCRMFCQIWTKSTLGSSTIRTFFMEEHHSFIAFLHQKNVSDVEIADLVFATFPDVVVLPPGKPEEARIKAIRGHVAMMNSRWAPRAETGTLKDSPMIKQEQIADACHAADRRTLGGYEWGPALLVEFGEIDMDGRV